MPVNKLQRINEDIQRAVAALLRNIKDPRLNQGMVSITAVDTTGDLRQATIYISVFGLTSEKDFKAGLKSAAGYIRHELGQILSLRYTPELIFELDKSIEHGAKINAILSTLEVPGDSPGDNAGSSSSDNAGDASGNKAGEAPGNSSGDSLGNNPGDNPDE